MGFRYDIAALCAVFAVALWLIYRRDRARKQASRAVYFDDCRSLFEDCRVAKAGTDFPVSRAAIAATGFASSRSSTIWRCASCRPCG